MPTRQEQLLDAAIGVLGHQGVRQLTHRAVDAAAGLPAGSASNYFKTREALVAGIVERFAEQEQAAWETIAAFVKPESPAQLAAALATFVQNATGPGRALTIARYSLFVEASLRPDRQHRLEETARAIRQWGSQWLAQLGSADPEGDCQLILDQLDGLMLHQLAFPDPAFDPQPRLERLLKALLPGSHEAHL